MHRVMMMMMVMVMVMVMMMHRMVGHRSRGGGGILRDCVAGAGESDGGGQSETLDHRLTVLFEKKTPAVFILHCAATRLNSK